MTTPNLRPKFLFHFSCTNMGGELIEVSCVVDCNGNAVEDEEGVLRESTSSSESNPVAEKGLKRRKSSKSAKPSKDFKPWAAAPTCADARDPGIPGA